MSACFVIQRFDKGPFDKRYEDVFAPAIIAAGLEPYRVDRDPAVSIPIEQIEAGIRSSDLCLAEITTDNPNVWFELGFAIASKKEVILVCSEERTRFPFDVQHRSIISYSTESTRDFVALRENITKRIKAVLAKEISLEKAANISPIADVEGLAQHEIVALVSIAQNLDKPGEKVPVYRVKQDMEMAGFTKIATTIGLTALLRKDFAEAEDIMNDYGEPYTGYSLTEKGMDWLMNSQERLVLHQKKENSIGDNLPF